MDPKKLEAEKSTQADTPEAQKFAAWSFLSFSKASSLACGAKFT